MSFETTEWEHTCPWCGVRNEAASGREGTHPDDGDLLVCYDCRQPSIAVVSAFGMAARMPTDTELAKLRRHPQYKQALAAIAESTGAIEAAELLIPPVEF